MTGLAVQIDPSLPASRDEIAALADYMSDLPGAVFDFEPQLTHHFPPGIYAREIFIPKGQVIVGKIHLHDHLNNISQGKIAVVSEFGSDVFDAPHQFESKAGTRRAVVALEDTIWTTYHPNPTNTRDLAELEKQIIAPDYSALGFIE